MAKAFTDTNFESEVIEASKEKPVLVDFFASWCGPCKMQAPIVEELSEEMGDQAVVGKLDTEQSPETASKYNVMSIPTLIIYRNGEPVETMVGLQSKDSLAETLKKHA